MIVAGVDLGVRKAAIAILNGVDLVAVEAFESKAQTRSRQLYQVAIWVREMCDKHRVDVVYIEEPLIGRSTRVSLQIAQVAGAVLSHLSHVPHSYLVSNTAWKKAVIGVGAGKDIKLKIQMWLDEMFPGYATPCDGDQDKYDATCIAIYGRQQQQLATHLREDEDLFGTRALQDGEALA